MSCQDNKFSSNSSAYLAYYELKPNRNSSSNFEPIILMHGLFRTKETMKDLANNLHAQTGCHVVAVDLRNHGNSFHATAMDYASAAGDIALTMNSLNLRCAVIIGHSLGGRVAMTLALNYPDLVSRLVIEDTAPNTIDTPPILLDMFAAIKDTDWSTLPSEPAQAQQQLKPLIRSSIETANIGVRNGRCYWKMNVGALEENVHQLFVFPHQGVQYLKPALFIGGDLSMFMMSELDEEILQFFPCAVIKHLPDAGHWIHAERLDEFTAIVLNFLQQS